MFSPKTAWFLLLLLIVAIAGCDSKSDAAPAKRKPMRVAPAATVQAHTVAEGPLKILRDYGGEFVSDAMADLSAEVSGTVKDVRFRLGDRVEKGDVLAEIDPISYQQRVRELRASVALSRASVEEARALKANLEAELRRKEPLLERKLVTEREIEDLQSQIAVAQQRLDVAQATVQQNQARLDLGKDNLQDTRIRALFAGIVAERFVDLGNHINPGQPLFRVVDDREIYLRLRIAEHDSGMVTTGMKVTIRVDAIGGRQITGVIGRIAPAVDPQTRTLRVDVLRPAEDHAAHDAEERKLWERIKPGMYARAQIVVADRTDAISIPSQAVHKERDGSRYVWLVTDGKSQKRPITPGLRDRELLEVVDGLSKGDQIVMRGHEKLTEGGDVQLVRQDDGNTEEGS